jgi:hypothetical protein
LFIEEDKQHVLIVFSAKVEGNIQINYEIENVKWVTEKELDEFEFYALIVNRRYMIFIESLLFRVTDFTSVAEVRDV